MQWAIDNYKWPKVAGFPILGRARAVQLCGRAGALWADDRAVQLNLLTPNSATSTSAGGDTRINED